MVVTTVAVVPPDKLSVSSGSPGFFTHNIACLQYWHYRIFPVFEYGKQALQFLNVNMQSDVHSKLEGQWTYAPLLRIQIETINILHDSPMVSITFCLWEHASVREGKMIKPFIVTSLYSVLTFCQEFFRCHLFQGIDQTWLKPHTHRPTLATQYVSLPFPVVSNEWFSKQMGIAITFSHDSGRATSAAISSCFTSSVSFFHQLVGTISIYNNPI